MSPTPDHPRPFPPAAAAAVQRGDLIEATKIVRRETGLGLKEAKEWVERYRDDPDTLSPATIPMDDGDPDFPPPPDALPLAALDALRQRNLVEAIKIVREATGLGLKESKDRVDRYLAAHPELAARGNRAAGPQPGAGGLGWLAILVLIAALAYWWWRR